MMVEDVAVDRVRADLPASQTPGPHGRLIVNLMIEKGANHFNSGLYYACKGGHKEIVNLMMEKGADDFNWGLNGACLGGPKNTKVFVGAEIDAYASTRGHEEIVNLMIEKGANHFNNGLYYACEGGPKNIKVFVGAEVDAYASTRGHIEIINLMIEKKADIDFVRLKKFTAKNLLYAIIYSNMIIHNEKMISINDAIPHLFNENINEDSLGLLKDYEKEQLWKPSRHDMFTNEYKNRIYYFMVSIKKYSKEQLKQGIPKPLLWIIINMIIKK